jgi:hypothetical protein
MHKRHARPRPCDYLLKPKNAGNIREGGKEYKKEEA